MTKYVKLTVKHKPLLLRLISVMVMGVVNQMSHNNKLVAEDVYNDSSQPSSYYMIFV